jgi:hypothetical protein
MVGGCTEGGTVTVGGLLSALRRRWPVLVIGLLLTLSVSFVTWRAPGVYWASMKVYFLVPATTKQPNQIAPNNNAAIQLAGLIQTEVNGGVPPRLATSPDVTLVDQGIYDGWSVLLPDTGGQWADNFPEPTLIVQASGPTPEVVRTRMYTLLDAITRLVTAHEDEAHVTASSRVNFTMSPAVVAVQYSNGHRSRALAVIVVLGLLVSLAACVFADRVAGTRRRRGDQAHDGNGDARVRDTAGSDQDGSGREDVGAPSGSATARRGDRTAPGDA